MKKFVSIMLALAMSMSLEPFAFHKFIPSFHAISFESRPGPGFRGMRWGSGTFADLLDRRSPLSTGYGSYLQLR